MLCCGVIIVGCGNNYVFFFFECLLCLLGRWVICVWWVWFLLNCFMVVWIKLRCVIIVLCVLLVLLVKMVLMIVWCCLVSCEKIGGIRYICWWLCFIEDCRILKKLCMVCSSMMLCEVLVIVRWKWMFVCEVIFGFLFSVVLK